MLIFFFISYTDGFSAQQKEFNWPCCSNILESVARVCCVCGVIAVLEGEGRTKANQLGHFHSDLDLKVN